MSYREMKEKERLKFQFIDLSSEIQDKVRKRAAEITQQRRDHYQRHSADLKLQLKKDPEDKVLQRRIKNLKWPAEVSVIEAMSTMSNEELGFS